MKKLTIELLSAALACAPGLLLAQQQSPNPSSPPQNSQDVPHQQPGTNNPDLQQQRKPAPGKKPEQQPGSTNPSESTPDVPHQQPGTNNPDLAPQRRSTATDTSQTQQNSAKKRRKHNKQNSSASQSSTQR